MKPHIYWVRGNLFSHVTCYKLLYFIEKWYSRGTRYGTRYSGDQEKISTLFHL